MYKGTQTLAIRGQPVFVQIRTLKAKLEQSLEKNRQLSEQHQKEVKIIHKLQAELHRARFYDETTGLLNSRGFEKEVAQYFLSLQNGESAGSVVLIDLDDMKAINDKFGHDKGDEVVAFLAQSLKRYFRALDVLARKHRDAGDEFFIFLPGVSLEGAQTLLTERRTHFEKAVREKFAELHVPVSFSYGISETFSSVQETMKQAEIRMYADKRLRKRGR